MVGQAPCRRHKLKQPADFNGIYKWDHGIGDRQNIPQAFSGTHNEKKTALLLIIL